ncbi:MAG: hypothetical protein QOJ26_1522 [Thermoplasmata archaeon]|jgi:hypothetical protein|nr:hypothetical protein [Thermoplasmata archaeon]MEA3166650.1 hypothetical protein [Thermoplasmata archaeon]
MAKSRPRPAPVLRLQVLRADPEKYPSLQRNPSLERALRIRQELEHGRPRDEAVALADAAMGRVGKKAPERPNPGKSAKVAGRKAAHAAKRSR